MVGRSDRPSKPAKSHHPAGESRDALLKAAQKVFADKGYEGATVKDLADAAGVNISLVSYHFGGKENLYRSCMEQFGIERVESTERILKPANSAEDFKLRLRLFADEFINIHLKETHVCRLIHRAIETLDPVSLELFKSVFNRMYTALLNFIAAGQQAGLVRRELDTEIVAGLAFGALMHMIKSEGLRAKLGMRSLHEPAFRDAVIDHWVLQATEGNFTPNQTTSPTSTAHVANDANSEERK